MFRNYTEYEKKSESKKANERVECHLSWTS